MSRLEDMVRLYEEEGLTLSEIGEQYGITRQRVSQLIRESGLSTGEAHHGVTRRERARRAAHERVVAGETTAESEAEIFGISKWALVEYWRDLGLTVENQFTRSPQHGTNYRYRCGCKCDECVAAMRAEKRRMRERDEPPSHGLSGYVNYGCRCEVCTAANTQAGRDYAAKVRRRKRKEKTTAAASR